MDCYIMDNMDILIKEENSTISRITVQNRILSLGELVSVFPNATGLKYKNEDDSVTGVVTLKDKVFVTPSKGWGFPGRIYVVVNGTKKCGFKNFLKKKVTETDKLDKMETSIGRVVVGIGEWEIGKKAPRFKKRTLTNHQQVGGTVSVHPIDRYTSTSNDICRVAVLRFSEQNKLLFDMSQEYTLVYPDGTPVKNTLPDNETPFSIAAYKAYKGIPYDRIRLYICPTSTIHLKKCPVKKVNIMPVLSDDDDSNDFQEDHKTIKQPPSNAIPREISHQKEKKRLPSFPNDVRFPVHSSSLRKSDFRQLSSEHQPSSMSERYSTPECLPDQRYQKMDTFSGPGCSKDEQDRYFFGQSHQHPTYDMCRSLGTAWNTYRNCHSCVCPTAFHGCGSHIPLQPAMAPVPVSQYNMRRCKGSGRQNLSWYHYDREPQEKSNFTRENGPPKKFKVIDVEQITTFGKTVYNKPELFKIQKLDIMESPCSKKITLSWSDEEDILMIVDQTAFSSGGMRDAYLAKVMRGPTYIPDDKTYVLKLHQKILLDAYGYTYGSQEAKRLVEKEVQTQSFAKMLCDEYQRLSLEPGQLRVIPVYKATGPCGKHYTLEECLTGVWKKYNNNDGTPTSDFTVTSQRVNSFSHWALEKTDFIATVLDMQGVACNISDVEVATIDENLFGCGNLGEEAIKKFARHHTCSRFCNELGLSSIKERYIRSPVRVDSEGTQKDESSTTMLTDSPLPSLIDLTQSNSESQSSLQSSINKSQPNVLVEDTNMGCIGSWKCCVCLTQCQGQGGCLIPCGHSQFCLSCCVRLNAEDAKCPICREDIADVLKIFM